MKKVLLLAVAGVFVLASCAKDRTCECSYDGVPSSNPRTYKNVTKSFMKNNIDCVSYEYSYTNSSNVVVNKKVECEIK